MQLSAEIRGFWKDHPPSKLQDWFADPVRHSGPLAPAVVRVDHYLRSSNPELGIKLRGDSRQIEIKGLVAVDRKIRTPPFPGSLEIWSKWACNLSDLRNVETIAVRKKRRQRLFDMTTGVNREVSLVHRPADGSPLPQLSRGCFMELTEVCLGHETWWTFAFETFGALETIAMDLRTIADDQFLRHLPPLSDGLPLSYPAWLQLNVSQASPSEHSL